MFRVVVSRLREIEARFFVLFIARVAFPRFGDFVVAEARRAFVELDLFAERHPVRSFDHRSVLIRDDARASKVILCQIADPWRRGRIILCPGRVFRDERSSSIIDVNGCLGR